MLMQMRYDTVMSEERRHASVRERQRETESDREPLSSDSVRRRILTENDEIRKFKQDVFSAYTSFIKSFIPFEK